MALYIIILSTSSERIEAEFVYEFLIAVSAVVFGGIGLVIFIVLFERFILCLCGGKNTAVHYDARAGNGDRHRVKYDQYKTSICVQVLEMFTKLSFQF